MQVPTTCHAAVDSSVGGKTAVNLSERKNLAGAFHPPSLVVCDTDAINARDEETYADGLAEMVKYAVLCSSTMLDEIVAMSRGDEEDLIARSILIKDRYVSGDLRDQGARQMLNLGHTIGHALEQASDFLISHGQAVAVGLATIARASEKRGLCPRGTASRICEVLNMLGMSTSLGFDASVLARHALHDKKRDGDKLTLVIPREIGRCELLQIEAGDIEQWIRDGSEAV